MRKKLFTFLLALAASVGMMNAAVDGKLPGAFSVSGTKVVYFSKGNLQYQASTNTWRFAENQYDAVGGSNGEGCAAPYNNTSSANQSPSDSQTGWIDLFGWAASGISRTGVTAYQPYSTSETETDYGTTATTSADETLGNYDWGKNMGDDWRTLTAEEWGYLIGPGNGGTNPSGQRANYQSLRGLCYITVGSTSYPGLMILPDDLYNNLPTATEGDIATKWAACAVAAGNSLQYTNATFTEKEWTALQDAGAVFLPAAGFRNGTAVHRAGANGNYWSSSASLSTNAFYLYFRAGYLNPEYSNYRNSGRSVRLVSETAPSGGSTSSVTAARFLYNYDCQRSPAFPKVNNACSLSGFRDPYEGYKGTRNGNIALGPWKLEFVAYYTPSNNYGCASQVNEAVYEYYNDLSGEEREAKKLEMPIFRLWQYNLTAQEFQPAAYGIVCAYAGEANAQDHAALFVSSNGMGCFLSGHQHTSSFALTCENDLTTGLTALVDAASAPSDPYYDVVWPVIVSIDAIGTVELSDYCKYLIEGSRAAYNALTDEQKAQVTNYSTLTNAETQWAALAAAAQPYADAVIALINAIPNPVVYTQDCKDKIDAAQNAYDALTDGQKMFVSNYETLKNAPSDLINAAPYVHILFTANNQERKVENVTLPKEFTDAEMKAMLKELYGVEGDYDMYAYDNSNADAVNISYEEWTISPFMGEVNVHGNMDKYDPQTGYEWIDFSLEISLELPPFGPAPASSTPETSDNVDGIEEYIESLNGNTTDLIINRTMYKDGYFNTLCLPFSMNASEIAASCLAGCELFEFESATANGGGLDLYIAEADAIVAGKPYLIRWASGENLTSLSFTGVTITASTGQAVGEGVQFVGTIGRTQLENGNENHLFLGANNTLYWPNTNNKLKGFRAYFLVSGSVAPHGAPARVVVRPKTPTAIENVNVNAKAVKLLRDGQLFIIKNGVKYNAQGQIVK